MAEKPAEGLCKLFGRTTKFNIIIYITALSFIAISGSFWIYGITRSNPDEKKMWTDKAYISFIIGVIAVSFLWAANMIYYELAFNKKCVAVEKFIDKQINNLRDRLSSKNFAKETSRIVADTFTDELKKQLSGTFLESLLPPGKSIKR